MTIIMKETTKYQSYKYRFSYVKTLLELVMKREGVNTREKILLLQSMTSNLVAPYKVPLVSEVEAGKVDINICDKYLQTISEGIYEVEISDKLKIIMTEIFLELAKEKGDNDE